MMKMMTDIKVGLHERWLEDGGRCDTKRQMGAESCRLHNVLQKKTTEADQRRNRSLNTRPCMCLTS